MKNNIFAGVRASCKKYFSNRYFFWWQMVSLIFIFVVGVSTSWQYRIETAVQQLSQRQQTLVNLAINSITRQGVETALHAAELRESSVVIQFMEQRTERAGDDVTAIFGHALATYSRFDYINIVDATGIEIIRVNTGIKDALPLRSVERKDWSETVIFTKAVELSDNQFMINSVAPLSGKSVAVLDATPVYQVVTPIAISGKRYGYLIYNLKSQVFVKGVAAATSNWPIKSLQPEVDVYTVDGVWSIRGGSEQFNWVPLPSDAEVRKNFLEPVAHLSSERISERWMQFVYVFGRKAPENSDITAFEWPQLPDGLELISGINESVPVVLRVNYEGILASIRLSARDRWVELAAAILAGVICAYGFNWLTVWTATRRRESLELNDIGNRDFLTGIMSRKAFLAYASSNFISSPELPRPCATLILNVDFFREVNDNYGHLAGDTVLKKMTEVAQIGFREHDRIARWGGDEFVLLLTNVESSQILGVAERIRRRVAQMQYKIEEAVNIQVTASIGAASIRGGSDMDAISVMDSIRTADKALYRAKKGGGNRVAMISEDPGSSAYGLSITSDVS